MDDGRPAAPPPPLPLVPPPTLFPPLLLLLPCVPRPDRFVVVPASCEWLAIPPPWLCDVEDEQVDELLLLGDRDRDRDTDRRWWRWW